MKQVYEVSFSLFYRGQNGVSKQHSLYGSRPNGSGVPQETAISPRPGPIPSYAWIVGHVFFFFSIKNYLRRCFRFFFSCFGAARCLCILLVVNADDCAARIVLGRRPRILNYLCLSLLLFFSHLLSSC